MKGMIQYEIWITIEIGHEYYANNNVPLLVTPDIETRLLFAKYNIIFRKQRGNQWVLLKPSDDVLMDKEELVFRFELQISSEEFYYSTGDYIMKPDSLFVLKETHKPNVWKVMEIPYSEAINEEDRHISLQLESKRKYLEYLFIPKYTLTKDLSLKLEEERGRIEFERPKVVTLFEETNVIRFISREQVSLKKSNDYKIRLWEVRPTGEKLLSEYIPYPKAEDISVIQPQDSITTYYYF